MTHLSRRSALGLAAAAVAAPLVSTLPARAEVDTELRADVWTPVYSGAPGQSYWTAPFDPVTARDLMRVGYGNDPVRGLYVWRSFFRIPLSGAAGLTIDRLTLRIRVAQAASGLAQIGLYQVPDLDPAVPVTWNNTSSSWTTLLDQPLVDGFGVEFTGDALTTAVKAAIARGARDISFGLRNTRESQRGYWRGLSPDPVSLLIASS